MAQKTRAQILNEIAALLPTNGSGLITATALRTVENDVADSFWNPLSDGDPATVDQLANKVDKEDPSSFGNFTHKTNIFFAVQDDAGSVNRLLIDAGGAVFNVPISESVRSITDSDSTTLDNNDVLVNYARTDSSPLVFQNVSDVNPGRKVMVLNVSANPVVLGAAASGQFFDSTSGSVNSITVEAKETVFLEIFTNKWSVVSRYGAGVLVALATFIIQSDSVILAATETTAKTILSGFVITGYVISSNSGGSISVDIQKASAGGSFSSIVASAPCILSSGTYVNSTTLTGWTTTLAAFNRLKAVVNSASSLTDAAITIYGRAA